MNVFPLSLHCHQHQPPEPTTSKKPALSPAPTFCSLHPPYPTQLSPKLSHPVTIYNLQLTTHNSIILNITPPLPPKKPPNNTKTPITQTNPNPTKTNTMGCVPSHPSHPSPLPQFTKLTKPPTSYPRPAGYQKLANRAKNGAKSSRMNRVMVDDEGEIWYY